MEQSAPGRVFVTMVELVHNFLIIIDFCVVVKIKIIRVTYVKLPLPVVLYYISNIFIPHRVLM